MIVGLDLEYDVDRFGDAAIDTAAGGSEIAYAHRAGNDGGIVPVGRQHAVRTARASVADHREQGFLLLLTVDAPGRIEDLVAAVLGIHLRKHHEFDVGRIATHAGEACAQIVNLVR